LTNEVNQTVLVKLGGLLSSSSLIADMIIFNDPLYPILAIVGGILSLVGLLHEIYHEDSLHSPTVMRLVTEMFKSVMLGGLLTPIFFMLYSKIGGEVLNNIFDIKGFTSMGNSFWFLLSLISGWYAMPIWDRLVKTIIDKGKQ